MPTVNKQSSTSQVLKEKYDNFARQLALLAGHAQL